MPDYHKIIYIDCDLVVNEDLAELYQFDLHGNVIGAAWDIDVAGLRKTNRNEWQQYASNVLGLDEKDRYFQAGVLIIDLDALRKITDAKALVQMAVTHQYRCHDQDVLNIVCKNKVEYLPQKWNVLMNWVGDNGACRMNLMRRAPHDLYFEYLEARKQPYIVHYAGYQKPWHVVDCDLSDYFWSYAKESLFYPWLIDHLEPSRKDNTGSNTVGYVHWLRKLQDKLFPRGTKRRSVIDRIYIAVHKI